MTQPERLLDGVYWLGAVDWDRRLFDSLIPLRSGTTYNSYLIRGETKTALIDTVDEPFGADLVETLRAFGVNRLDYVVSNHAEQDHSGALPAVLDAFGEAEVLATPKAIPMLTDLLGVPAARMRAVSDGEALSLGGRTLRFLHAPWVHWPETMLTLLEEDRVLFTGDLFGVHLARGSALGADSCEALLHAKQYFGAIMMPYRAMIAKYLDRIEPLAPRLIASTHGPVWSDPRIILEAYRAWATDAPRNLAVIAHVSMHGSTRSMVAHLADALSSRKVETKVIHLADLDLGGLAATLVDAATVVFATPTVMGGVHPLAAQAAFLANLIRPKARWASFIGSYGWGGKAPEQLLGMMPALKVEVLPPVLSKGRPGAEAFSALDGLADSIAARHMEMSRAQ